MNVGLYSGSSYHPCRSKRTGGICQDGLMSSVNLCLLCHSLMFLVFVLLLLNLIDARFVLLECPINQVEDWSRLKLSLDEIPEADIWNEQIDVPMTASVQIPEEKLQPLLLASMESMQCQMTMQPLVLSTKESSDDFTVEVAISETSQTSDDVDVSNLMVRVSKEYLSYQELLGLFDHLEKQSKQRNTSNVHVKTIAKSHHSLPIKVLSITHAKMPASKDVWVSCGQHAREWIAISACANLAVRLATSDDAQVQVMLQKANVHVVPLMNPDGYIMSQKKDRMWRKNVPRKLRSMRDGVDLNRNWPAHWGQESSVFDQTRNKQKESLTFRGPSAASEPEVAGTIQYMTGAANMNLICAFDVHSYGQFVLRPPGYINEPNASEFANKMLGDAVAMSMSSLHDVKYKSQLSAGLYPTFGGMDDWLHETFDCPAFTVELRDNGRFGFLLPADQIEATSEELFSAVSTSISIIVND